MNAVEAGETYHITRNGVEVAELRPLTRRRHPTAEELVARHRRLPRADLPAVPELTAITLAELHQGVAMAKDPAVKAARMEKLPAAAADFDPLPFDSDAATRYGTLVTLTIAGRRDQRPRRTDLMIAAIASVRGLPLPLTSEQWRGRFAGVAFPADSLAAWLHAAYRHHLGLKPLRATPRPDWTWPHD